MIQVFLLAKLLFDQICLYVNNSIGRMWISRLLFEMTEVFFLVKIPSSKDHPVYNILCPSVFFFIPFTLLFLKWSLSILFCFNIEVNMVGFFLWFVTCACAFLCVCMCVCVCVFVYVCVCIVSVCVFVSVHIWRLQVVICA